jgi:hypothetical protein
MALLLSSYSLSCLHLPLYGIISFATLPVSRISRYILYIPYIIVRRFFMCLSAPKPSLFDLARTAGLHLISTPDLTAASSFALAGPSLSAAVTSVPDSTLRETSVNDVIWVGVRRPS